MENHTNTKRQKKKRKISTKKLLRLSIIMAFLVLGLSVGFVVYAAQSMPEWDPELLSGARTTFIYDDQQRAVAQLHAAENRIEVTRDKIPLVLQNAVISIEDKNFYSHHGINIKGMFRALYVNFTTGDLAQGASTITQQLARNAFLTLDKKWERKIKEIFLSFKLESLYTKDEILTMYLNKIPFGAGAYGAQAASTTYFGKDVGKLNLAEASLIAGLPQSPNAYNPFINLDKAKNRQKMVLNSMVENGYITQNEADKAFAEELKFLTKNTNQTQFGFYVDAVIDEAIEILKEKKIENPSEFIYQGGLKIYTAMNSDLQNLMETSYSVASNFPNETKNGQIVQSAAVVIDHSSGAIKSLMGGRQYQQKRGFNRATSAYRQTGSVIKPLTVFSPALEQGYMPYVVLNDSPLAIKVGNTIWRPENYDHSYRGPITMRTAVQYSVNTYAVQLLQQIGVEDAFKFGLSLGLELVDSPNKNDLGLAPLSLGGLTRGATPVQMAEAFGTIGNQGEYTQPYVISSIVDSNGLEIFKRQVVFKRVMTAQSAWLMNSMLQTVVNSGTGTRAKIPNVETCGKTGTSEEYANSWFCGFTPQYSCAVWMGYDQQEYNMNRVAGGSYPAQLFKTFLTKAHERGGATTFSRPDGIVSVTVCAETGLIPSEFCIAGTITDLAINTAVPTKVCNHKSVMVCPISNKIAGPYCPNPEPQSALPTEDDFAQEICDIHTTPTNIDSINNNSSVTVNEQGNIQIAVCTDSQHGGNIYRANIAQNNQSGGCPYQFIQYITVSPNSALPPYCNLNSHQITNQQNPVNINSNGGQNISSPDDIKF